MNVAGNHIADIDDEDFKGFNKYLLVLSMASNSLVEIPAEAFKSLTSLKQLDLRDNNIRSIRITAFKVGAQFRGARLEHRHYCLHGGGTI